MPINSLSVSSAVSVSMCWPFRYLICPSGGNRWGWTLLEWWLTRKSQPT